MLNYWTCDYCGEAHALKYVQFVDGRKHLAYHCNRKQTTKFIKFIPGLTIPTEFSKRAFKENTQLALL